MPSPSTTLAPLRRAGACAALLAALAACAPMAPPAAEPRPGIPAAFPGASGSDSAPVAAATAWQDFFTEPELRALISGALEHNRDLRAAVLRTEEARAAWGIQRAQRAPGLALALEGARSRIPGDLSPTGQPVVGDQFQLGVGFTSWELDFWGRIRSLEDAAIEGYLATDAARRAATIGLVAQVAQAWLALRETERRLLLAQRALDSRAESLRIHRRRVELGASSRLELTQVELLFRQAASLRAQLEQARAAQANALRLLAGSEPDLPQATADGSPLARLPELPADLPSSLLLERPDLVAAEHRLRAAGANIAAARAAFFPRIALTATAGTASTALGGLFEGSGRAWTFAPSVMLPIFDGGRLGAALELAAIRREQAVVDYEKTVQAAFRDVADALSARRWLGEQASILEETLQLQAERARLARLRHASGAASYLEVLDAERELLTVEQQLVQAQRAHLSAQVALYAALGGGARHLPAADPGASNRANPAAPEARR